jgi:hypothetical protein
LEFIATRHSSLFPPFFFHRLAYAHSLSLQRDHIHTVQDALSGLSQAQSVQLTQSTRPGVIIEGQQQSLIEVLPPILVLQLKRFGYDTMGVAKVGKQVRFGSELEIGHGMELSFSFSFSLIPDFLKIFKFRSNGSCC